MTGDHCKLIASLGSGRRLTDQELREMFKRARKDTHTQLWMSMISVIAGLLLFILFWRS